MEIKEFVTALLAQIAEGTAAAQEAVRNAGGFVNPATSGFTVSTSKPFPVKFDIAVTVSDQSKGDGGAQLKIASVFSVGGSASTTATSETVGRLKFEVPLALPVDQKSMELAQESHQEMTRKLRGNVMTH